MSDYEKKIEATALRQAKLAIPNPLTPQERKHMYALKDAYVSYLREAFPEPPEPPKDVKELAERCVSAIGWARVEYATRWQAADAVATLITAFAAAKDAEIGALESECGFLSSMIDSLKRENERLKQQLQESQS